MTDRYVVARVAPDELGDYLNGRAIKRQVRPPREDGQFVPINPSFYAHVFVVRPPAAELVSVEKEEWTGYGSVEEALDLSTVRCRVGTKLTCFYRVVWDMGPSGPSGDLLLLQALKAAHPMITMTVRP